MEDTHLWTSNVHRLDVSPYYGLLSTSSNPPLSNGLWVWNMRQREMTSITYVEVFDHIRLESFLMKFTPEKLKWLHRCITLR